ncbi:MAG: hypothetical protein R2719_03920 [Micropruina sp.]
MAALAAHGRRRRSLSRSRVAVEAVPSALGPSAIAGYAWLCLASALLAYPLWFTGIARLR